MSKAEPMLYSIVKTMKKFYAIGLISLFCFSSLAMDPPVNLQALTNTKGAHCHYFEKGQLRKYISDIKKRSVSPQEAFEKANELYKGEEAYWRRFAARIFLELIKHRDFVPVSLQFAKLAIMDPDPSVRNAALEIYMPRVKKKKNLKEAIIAATTIYKNLPFAHPFLIDSFWRINREFMAYGLMLEVANKMAFQCLHTEPRCYKAPDADFHFGKPMKIAYDGWTAALEFYIGAVERGKFVSFAKKAHNLLSPHSEVSALSNALLIALENNDKNFIKIPAKDVSTRSALCLSLSSLACNHHWKYSPEMSQAYLHILQGAKDADHGIKYNKKEIENNPYLMSLIFLNFAQVLKCGEDLPEALTLAQQYRKHPDEWIQQALQIFDEEYKKFRERQRNIIPSIVYQ